MKPLLFLVALLLSPLAFAVTNAPPTEKQKQLLEEILRILPRSESWERWVKATGSYPPDFDTMTNFAFLPDPLRLANGREVKKPDWPRRRQELLAQFQYWVTGSWPFSPGNTQLADLKQREEGGSTVQQVVLEFGPNGAAKLNLELIIPKGESSSATRNRSGFMTR